jgi:hypothetical protein
MVSPRVYYAGGSGGTQWESGASDPGAGLGTIGDWFENKTTREIFEKIDATTWESRGFATVETVWYTGAGVPGVGIGKTGDWYENTTTKEMYQKISPTVWTLRGSIGGAAWTMNDTAPSSPALGDIWAPRYGVYVWSGASWTPQYKILPRYNSLNSNFIANDSNISDSITNCVAIGSSALSAIQLTATDTIAIGFEALRLYTTGNDNLAIGHLAGTSLVTGNLNCLIGNRAGQAHLGSVCLAVGHRTRVGNNAAATQNVSIGYNTGAQLTTGSYNVMLGINTAIQMTTGAYNTAIGNQSMYYISTGQESTALGFQALQGKPSVSTATKNTSIGAYSMLYASTAQQNTAVGISALQGSNGGFSGTQNVSIGQLSMGNAVSASRNVAVGLNAMNQEDVGADNVAIGCQSAALGYNNRSTFLGASSGTSLAGVNDAIAIGYNTKATANGEIRIGTTSQTSLVIPRFTASGTLQTDASGNITSTSDIAIKEEVRKIYDPLSILPFLDGVTYRYTKDSKLDRTQRYAGCIANQWQCYFPDEVKAEKSSGLLSLNYNLPIAFLLETCKSLYTRLQDVEKRLNIQIGEPVSC